MQRNNAHHVGARGVACIFESAAEQLVDFPVGLLAVTTTIMDVLAAGAELARLGTDGAEVVGRRHNGARC